MENVSKLLVLYLFNLNIVFLLGFCMNNELVIFNSNNDSRSLTAFIYAMLQSKTMMLNTT